MKISCPHCGNKCFEELFVSTNYGLDFDNMLINKQFDKETIIEGSLVCKKCKMTSELDVIADVKQ